MISASDMVLAEIDQSVRPSEDDLRLMAARADEVANALMGRGSHLNCHLVGSITRSTALAGYSDVDLVAIADFQNGLSENSQRAIAELETILLDADFAVETDEFAVSVKFDRPPAVDVMPAMCCDGGMGYLIPAGHDAMWQEFFPDRLKELTARSMQSLGPRFGALVRLLKLWNISRGTGLKSSDLEELANVALGGQIRISSYSQDLTRVLIFAFEWVNRDPDIITKMGRPPPSMGRESRAMEIIQGSLTTVHAMQDANSEVKARRLTEEFFGDEFAKSDR